MRMRQEPVLKNKKNEKVDMRPFNARSMSRPHAHDKKHDSFMSVIIGTVVVAPGIPHWSPTRVTGPIRKRQRLVSVEMSKYSANILRQSTPNLGVQREEKPQTQHKQETQTLGCSTLQIQTHRHTDTWSLKGHLRTGPHPTW